MKKYILTSTLYTLLISGSFVSLPAFAAPEAAGANVSWTYSGALGPQNWANLDPDFSLCSEGKTQSPINIPENVPNVTDLLSIHYVPSPLVIMENGNTALMLGDVPTVFNDGHSIQVNFNNAKETINFDGTHYQLLQFHFHTPSETTINGKAFAGEIHFVHQGPNGSAAVLAVLIKPGKANPALQEILDHLPAQTGKASIAAGQNINPAALLPVSQNYYHFMGSLTTPPCTEGLQWFVLTQPITASPAQIRALTTAIGGPNARPTQPLNQRALTASVDQSDLVK
jgi:carbonic anhydrase